jgi:hypothetical protein
VCLPTAFGERPVGGGEGGHGGVGVVGVVELSRVALSPTDPDHHIVLRDIASMWDLDIPPAWAL